MKLSLRLTMFIIILFCVSCSNIRIDKPSNKQRIHLRAIASQLNGSKECNGLLNGSFEKNNPLEETLKTYPLFAPSNYHSIKHVNFKGMEKLDGQDSLIGKLAFVNFIKDGKTQAYTGRIFYDSQPGIRIVDERTGKVHDINVNYGKIESVKVEPREYFWTKPKYGSSKNELFSLIESKENPYGFISIGENHLYGELSVEQVESGPKVVILIDGKGNKHTLDPDYVGIDFSITSKKDAAEGLFSSFSGSPQSIIDTRRAERLDLIGDLISNEKYYNDSTYYDFFLKDIDYTKTLLARWYDAHAKEMIKQVSSELGEDYIVLLTDPGIANRLEQFVPFAKKALLANSNISPWELRKHFSDKLGTRKVQRQVMLQVQIQKL